MMKRFLSWFFASERISGAVEIAAWMCSAVLLLFLVCLLFIFAEEAWHRWLFNLYHDLRGR